MPNTASRAFKNPKSLFISHIHNSAIEASDTIYGENATLCSSPFSLVFWPGRQPESVETNAEADGAGHIDDRIKERLKKLFVGSQLYKILQAYKLLNGGSYPTHKGLSQSY